MLRGIDYAHASLFPSLLIAISETRALRNDIKYYAGVMCYKCKPIIILTDDEIKSIFDEYGYKEN